MATPRTTSCSDRFIKDRDRYEGGFWGGDLKGVIDKLDDLADLGVTAILLYPVMQNDERPVGKYLPTGYRPKDYERVDRNFGDVATLRSLVDAAHARAMRVILDMPITLPGFEHPFLADPAKKDWFGPPTQYGVPRWKVENPEVADYLIGVCKRWKERSGCDGFRIDSAHLQPVSFWKRFVAELKSAPPQGPFLILPELTINPREIGKFVTEAGFDGAYDFSAMRVREVFGKDAGRGAALLRRPRGEAVLSFAASHDGPDRQLRGCLRVDREGAEGGADQARPHLSYSCSIASRCSTPGMSWGSRSAKSAGRSPAIVAIPPS